MRIKDKIGEIEKYIDGQFKSAKSFKLSAKAYLKLKDELRLQADK